MSAEATVRSLFAAFAARDVDAALAAAAPDVHFWPQGTLEIFGHGAPYTGHDGLRRYFADVERGWTELTLDPRDVRVAGDGAVVFGAVRGITSAGERVDRQAIWVFKLRDGLVASVRAVGTTAEIHDAPT